MLDGAHTWTPATELAALLAAGTVTSAELVAESLARIEAIDRSGPALRAVLAVNPQAGELAAQLDSERAEGRVRGPLHGVPVLLKDNIATGDRMATTAGSLALRGVRAPRDAQLVARLREAGALILGKANLSEWANIRSTRSSSGWSALGGLTRNPHALDRSTSGSSSGSASAVAAGLCALAVGTETDGSIVSPASICGVVGFKPTVGLVSGDGIVPISRTQDTAGPMARTVADAALLLAALAGPGAAGGAGEPGAAAAGAEGAGAEGVPAVGASAELAGEVAEMAAVLAGGAGAPGAAAGGDGETGALRGVRLGIVRGEFAPNDRVAATFDRALAVLADQGAILVDDIELPPTASYADAELAVLLHELRADLPGYLAEFAPAAPVRSLADVIAFNADHPARTMPYFSQELFELADALGDLESPAYLDALAACRAGARTAGIEAALARHELAALIAPTGGPAWLTDLVGGDHYSGSFSTPAAVAGCPHLTVPMGSLAGLPLGLSFVGAPFTDAAILRLGHAYEQASHEWRAPTFAPTAPVGERLWREPPPPLASAAARLRRSPSGSLGEPCRLSAQLGRKCDMSRPRLGATPHPGPARGPSCWSAALGPPGARIAGPPPGARPRTEMLARRPGPARGPNCWPAARGPSCWPTILGPPGAQNVAPPSRARPGPEMLPRHRRSPPPLA